MLCKEHRRFVLKRLNMIDENRIYESTAPAHGAMPDPEAYRWLSQMARAIADEIRNPLAGIAGTISMLQDEVKDRFDTEKLRTIDSCIERIDSFIEDLYLLTKPVRPSFISIELSAFVERVALQYFKGKNVAYHFIGLDEPVMTRADLVLLQHALTRLLDNAAEAVRAGGEIFISLFLNKPANGSAHQDVSIAIRDTGEGMDEESIKKLFTPFFTTKHEGRGLGLVIARNYVSFHGGTIRIESQRSVGTQVVIDLPVHFGHNALNLNRWSWENSKSQSAVSC